MKSTKIGIAILLIYLSPMLGGLRTLHAFTTSDYNPDPVVNTTEPTIVILLGISLVGLTFVGVIRKWKKQIS